MSATTLPETVIPYYVQRELPLAVSSQLAMLPEDLQAEFFSEYTRRSKNIIIPYVLHFILPAHYLYLDKVITQLLFWFTFGGFGIWWFIDLFRIPSLVKKRNKTIADEVLRHVLIRNTARQARGNTQAQRTTSLPQTPAQPTPRDISNTYDPTRLGLEQLRTGYMLDYALKTWQVMNEIQFDWDDQTSERELKLIHMNDILYLSVKREGAFLHCHISTAINIYAIDKDIDTYISKAHNPPNVLQYADFTLYRDNKLSGYAFNRAYGNKASKTLLWDYYDLTRDYRLRIEQTEGSQYSAIFGKRVNEIEFSEILPSGTD